MSMTVCSLPCQLIYLSPCLWCLTLEVNDIKVIYIGTIFFWMIYCNIPDSINSDYLFELLIILGIFCEKSSHVLDIVLLSRVIEKKYLLSILLFQIQSEWKSFSSFQVLHINFYKILLFSKFLFHFIKKNIILFSFLLLRWFWRGWTAFWSAMESIVAE